MEHKWAILRPLLKTLIPVVQSRPASEAHMGSAWPIRPFLLWPVIGWELGISPKPTRICPGSFLWTVGSERLSFLTRSEPETEAWSLWPFSCCHWQPMKEAITQAALIKLLDQILPEARDTSFSFWLCKSTTTIIILLKPILVFSFPSLKWEQ